MEAPKSFVILIAVLMLAIGMPLYVSAMQSYRSLQPERLAGQTWERGDGLGYNVSLKLGKNGKYLARWVGCLGEYGRSEGTWREVDGGIELEASGEEGRMRDHLRRLERIELGSQVWLIPLEDIDEVKRLDVDGPFINFYAFKLARPAEDTSEPAP